MLLRRNKRLLSPLFPLALLVALSSAPARAETDVNPQTNASTKAAPAAPSEPPSPLPSRRPRPISGPRKALAAAGAVFPGFFAHGTGHFIAGDPNAGLGLLAVEGIGLGVAGTSLGVLAATGASRHFATPLVALTIAGGGLFVLSFFADLYGVLAPDSAFGSPPRSMPWIETQLGLRYVYNPTFAYRSFLVQSVDLRWRSLRLMPSGWFALDDTNSRVRALAAYRFTGPKTLGSALSADGSYLDLEGAFTHHRYTTEKFTITSVELSLRGRLDMDRFLPSLAGSFAEMSLGGAILADSYFNATTDGNTLLLGRFGYGVYIGRPSYPRGEVMVYYDHRRDDFAAGLKIARVGSGIFGHMGLEGKLYFNDQWGALLDAQMGSAYLAGLSVLYRHGGSP